MNEKMHEVLEQFATFGAPPVNSLSPQNARQLPELRDAVLGVVSHHLASRLRSSSLVEPIESVEHRTIPTTDHSLLLRVYHPGGGGLRPVLVYFHGGGWVIASLNTYDSSCRALANAAKCIVVSVAYRQAPEHQYPAARDDAFAAYEWVLANALSFGGDPTKVAVAGESAGGNLATVVAMMARDRKSPLPLHQLLIYPVTNRGFETESYREHADAKPLNLQMMQWFWSHYLKSGTDASDPYISPLRAESLRRMPPTTILLAEIDPLRSEGEAYADRLREAGVDVFLRRYPGVTHEFFGLSAVLDEAREAVLDAAERLRNAFDSVESHATDARNRVIEGNAPPAP